MRRFFRSSRLRQVLAVASAVMLLTTCNDQPTTVSGPVRVSPPSQPSLATGDAPPVLIAAGNIARCDRTNDEATATLLDGIAGTVVSLGDAVYGDGSQADFDACYRPSWGRHKDRTRATPGDEEYETAGGAGYFSYFGAAAGEAPNGYYSFNLGTWHIVALNSNLSTSATSAQVAWLKADLASTPQPCVLAFWHHPRFSSYGTAVRSSVKAVWDALYAAQADVVLNAHYRLYERFALQTPTEVADPARGIRQFTVGTGGQGFHATGTLRPNSEVQFDDVYGVLKLTLDGASYAWEFVATTGLLDSGIGTCHGRPGSPPPPNQAPIGNAGGPYQSEGTVTFDGSASRDPDGDLPLTYLWDFGGGATATGVAPSRTYSQAGTTTVSLTVTDAEGLAGTPVTTTVTIGNLPPSVNAGADATVPHGTAFALDASFGDPGGQGDSPWRWTIAWGDGASESGTVTSLGGPIARSHTYAALGTYTVRLTVTDKDDGSATDELFATVFDPNAEAVLVGAGDIAACWQNRDEMTAALIDNIPGTVILLGDNAYGQGTAEEYANCYHPTWGRHKARTKPSPGNHEYGSSGAPGYFGYFGAVAGDPSKGWYSYDAGSWHIIVLNSGKEDFFEAAPGSPQNAWLRADLEANRTLCTLAYWHHPLITSSAGRTTNNDVRPFWDLLYEFGVDVILNGHDHSYQRFAPMRPDETVDTQFGILAITAGTGGESLYSWGPTIHPNTVERNNVAHGVLKMTLRPGTYEWEFIPIPGQTYSDRGTGTCHGAPSGEPPPNQAPTANHGGPYQADQTVVFNGSGSDPDGPPPLRFAWTFHDGSTSTLANPTKAYAADGSYTATLIVSDGLNSPSAPAVATVTIANVAPSVNAGPDAAREAGEVYALSASFTDPGGAADAPWSYTIAWGDGATTPPQGSATTSTSPITAGHAYETPGVYTVTVTVTDKDGGSDADEAIVTVTAPTPNQAPTANAGGPYTADNTVTFNGTGNDPDDDVPLTYRWTFHDASTSDVASPTRSYSADGTYSATLVVTDAKGLPSAPADAAITIGNVAPSVNAGPDRGAQAGSSLAFSASFTDPGGTLDGPWSWFITWGDGTRTPATGTSSTPTSPLTSSHTYAAPGEYDAEVTVIDKDGGTASDVVRITVTPAGASSVLVGAGNIARCDGTNDNATGALLAGIPGTVFTTGDNIHATGTLADFQNCYGPAWGGALARTRPTPGDDDYKTAGAAGYFSYFGAPAGVAGEGYYSYDLGNWHIVVLNSNVSMTATSPQVQWLTQDLAQTTKPCVLAYWHHPRFSSYGTGVRPEVKPLWDALYAARADVVLNGHYRLYERFAPQTPTGTADPTLGIAQFTVGTGGHGTVAAGAARPNSAFRSPSGTYGVLKLTLAADSYSWEFVAVPGQTVSDTGTKACHPAAP